MTLSRLAIEETAAQLRVWLSETQCPPTVRAAVENAIRQLMTMLIPSDPTAAVSIELEKDRALLLAAGEIGRLTALLDVAAKTVSAQHARARHLREVAATVWPKALGQHYPIPIERVIALVNELQEPVDVCVVEVPGG